MSTGSSQIKVAVIDDGVEDHEDLNDTGSNSRILSGITIGLEDGDGSPVYSDDRHGQACAGIIAASHNDKGIKGIAPNVRIIPINKFAFELTASENAAAIDWAWDEGDADILSNSWGYSGEDTYFDCIADAITNARTQGRNGKGSIVIFSAGNTSSYVKFPAKVTGVISVGAIDKRGDLWSYSARGSRIDIVAPSGDVDQQGDVRTIDRMGSNGYNSGNYYDSFGGTSAACPQVAGVAALMLSVNTNLTETTVTNWLKQYATDMGSAGKDNTFGYGRVDAFKSVAKVYSSINSQYPLTILNSSKTKLFSDKKMTFVVSPKPGLAAGQYYCDVYRIIANVTKSEYETGPTLVYTGLAGYSTANPNYASAYFDKTDNSSVIACTTYCYYIKSNTLGQSINQWAPFNPDGNNSAIEYAVLGKKEVPPPSLSVTISGPSIVYGGGVPGSNNSVDENPKQKDAPARPPSWAEVTYTANPNGGIGSYAYRWESKPWSSSAWSFVGNTKEYTLFLARDMDLKCTVTSGSQTMSTNKHIDFRSGGRPFISEIPTELTLKDNYPNPFNPSTTIKFGLPEDQHVKLTVYNIASQKVISLADQTMEKGYHDVTWYGVNNQAALCHRVCIFTRWKQAVND